jgi:hypothetical protein
LQWVGGPPCFAWSYGTCTPSMTCSSRLWNCPCKANMHGYALHGWYGQSRQNGHLLITGHDPIREKAARQPHIQSSRMNRNLIPCYKWVQGLLRHTTAAGSCCDAVRPGEPRGRRSRVPRAEEGPTRATRHTPEVSTPPSRTITVHRDLSSPTPFRCVRLVTNDTRNRHARHRLSKIHSPTSLAFWT